jgi:hypothetical protein
MPEGARLLLEPVAHPIDRFDQIAGIVRLPELLAQTLDVAIDRALVDINIVS